MRSTRKVARRDGFTLVELIVVMLILTIVTGVTVPALLAGREPDDDLTGAVRRVEELFRLARDSAIRGNTGVTVVIDSATNFVWLVPDVVPGAAVELSSGLAGGSGLAASGSVAGLRTGPRTPGGGGAGSVTGTVAGGVALLDEGTALNLPATVEMRLGQTRARFTFLPTGATIGDSIVIAHAGAGVTVRLTLDPWTGDVIAR